MPKSLAIGNGNMLINLNKDLHVTDIYYPHVGLEEHTTYKNYHHLGFYIEGKFAWMNDESWEIKIDYEDETLVGRSIAINKQLEIEVHFQDFVYSSKNIFFRNLKITNLANKPRTIKVFFAHNLFIYGDKLQDTAQYEPDINAVLHYRRNRYFLINGCWKEGKQGMDQYAIGKSGFRNFEGTFKDAENDGELGGNPIEQGSVDSTVRFINTFESGESKTLFFWLSIGKKYEEVQELNQRVSTLSPEIIYEHTANYWRKWVNKEQIDFGNLPDHVVALYKRSLLIIRTQIDNGGAIIAANDTDIQKFNRDTYSYMWPRDGAFVTMALCDAGYEKLAENFFLFIEKLITKDGYLLNKYHPDGAVGSSWHPKIKDNELQLPIQEDESALILVALEKYYKTFRNIEIIKNLFNSIILKIGKWLMTYIDIETGLPLPSYDLWEEHRAVHSYTATTVYAGLKAASFLSEETGHQLSADTFKMAAENMKKSILKNLYSEEIGRFFKYIKLHNGQITEKCPITDASLALLWSLGLLQPDDIKIRQTMDAININLTIPTKIGGIARYQKDNYFFDFGYVDHNKITGNPWIITTLWEADWQIATADHPDDLVRIVDTLLWVCERANSAGLLPEQLHPLSGEPFSVSPLTWSHATFVATIHRYLDRYHQLNNNCQ